MKLSSLVPMIFLVAIMLSWRVGFAQETAIVNLAGKWVGRWRTPNYNGPAELALVQTGKDLSGKVLVEGRPRLRNIRATSYEASVAGKVEGNKVSLTWVNSEGEKAIANFALSPENLLKGSVDTGAGVFSDWELRKID